MIDQRFQELLNEKQSLELRVATLRAQIKILEKNMATLRGKIEKLRENMKWIAANAVDYETRKCARVSLKATDT